MRNQKFLTIRNLVASCLFGCAALSGCGQDAVHPTLVPIDRVSSGLSMGTLFEATGTYGASCLQRTGSWSVGINGATNLISEPLSVVQDDVGCSLQLTSLHLSTGLGDVFFAPASPIQLGANYYANGFATRQNGMDPPLFANARISPDMTFHADFQLQIAYSDDPLVVTAGRSASYTVEQASGSSGAVPAPDYFIDLSGITFQTNAQKVVQSASGAAALSFNSIGGQNYVVTATDLGPNPSTADIAADFQAGTQSPLVGNPIQIDVSAFNLVGKDLTANAYRNVIARNTDSVSGLSSYELFKITFSAP